jgi:hypothetical protein
MRPRPEAPPLWRRRRPRRKGKGIKFEKFERVDPSLPAVPPGAVKRFEVDVYEHVTKVSDDLAAAVDQPAGVLHRQAGRPGRHAEDGGQAAGRLAFNGYAEQYENDPIAVEKGETTEHAPHAGMKH